MTLDSARTVHVTSPSQGRLATIAPDVSRLVRIRLRRIVSWSIDPAHPGLQAHDLADGR